MDTTTPSLLARVRNPSDHAAWREFDARYRDLLIRFCRRRGVPHDHAEDLVQAVFGDLARSLPQFTYDPQRGRFRDYLYRCVSNAISDWARRPNRRLAPVQEIGAVFADGDGCAAAGRDGGASDAIWEQEWIDHHFRLAMRTIRASFDEKSAQIFERSIAGAKVADLAREFAMSEQAVHKVRQRIRDRMEELIAAQVREEDALDTGDSH